MEFKDYYKILGVEPEADAKTIKTAYRKLAKKYHPDVSDHAEAEEKFKEVAEAYEVLKNAERRAEYDELRQYAKQGGGFQPPPDWQSSARSSGFDSGFSGQGYSNQGHSDQGFSDFFSSIFGGAGRADQQGFRSQQSFDLKGQDIETELPIFLEDTLTETTKTISIRLPHQEADGRISQIDKKLNVKIPAGVSDGEQIRLRGQGGEGLGNAAHGDLYLRIRLVPHPLFDVEAHNLIITMPLAPWEAALGCKIEVPTLSGKINLSIPANSQTGQRMRVKGKGLVSKTGQGDLYAVLKVVMPSNTNEEIQQHWQQLAGAAAFDPRAEWRN